MLTDLRPILHDVDWDGADRLTVVLMEAFKLSLAADPTNPSRSQVAALAPALENLSQKLLVEMERLSEVGGCPSQGPEPLREALERLGARISTILGPIRAARC